MNRPLIETVTSASENEIQQLANVLVDAVDGGSSVSFMSGLTVSDAAAWWRKTLAGLSPRGALFIARDDDGVIGTVLLLPAWPPNQPHRADVAKLIVHRRARRRGVARALMSALERHARDNGFTVLVLDTCKGSPAEQLYTTLGWNRVGEVPFFALLPDGSPCDTVFFYKRL